MNARPTEDTETASATDERLSTLTIGRAARADRVPHRRAPASAVAAVLGHVGFDGWPRGGTSRASVDELRRWTGYSRRTVQNALADLIDGGILLVSRRPGQRTSYRLESAHVRSLASLQPAHEVHPRTTCTGAGDAREGRTPDTPPAHPVHQHPLERDTRETTKERDTSGALDSAAGSLSQRHLPKLGEIVEAIHAIARGLECYADRNNAHAVARRLADAPRRTLDEKSFRPASIINSVRRIAEQAGSAGGRLPSAVVIVKAVETAAQERFETQETPYSRPRNTTATAEVPAGIGGGLQ